MTDEDTLEEMFGRKQIKPKKAGPSALTTLLKISQSMDPKTANPFEEYIKFNGEVKFIHVVFSFVMVSTHDQMKQVFKNHINYY